MATQPPTAFNERATQETLECAMGKPPHSHDPGLTSREIDVGGSRIATTDPEMRSVFDRILCLAPIRLPILVHGESGVGKELIARALHANSPWRNGPFVPINCGALPAGLVESELFGHERGAFSGAGETKLGLFEAAVGGTLFLDEIGELPIDLQARLLRFLDDYLVRRVGGVSARAVDIRVVAATNRDLSAFVAEGRFRGDLFHRLSGGVLEVPPLRSRRTDLQRLATDFLQAARDRAGRSRLRFSDAAALALLRHHWSGNVRELKHAMEYVAATVEGGEVGLEHLPTAVCAGARLIDAAKTGRALVEKRREGMSSAGASPARFLPIKEQVNELVRTCMLDALSAAHWNVARAARLLRMSRRTFIKKMKAYGLRDLHRNGED